MSNPSDLPSFDEVHVVSDLHLGGRAGFQVLCETGRLANFIRRLARQRPEGRLALVLNGDVFDTLAEDIDGYLAIDDAPETVARIVHDPSFAPVWQALAGFVGGTGRTLIFTIGNHDLEIALPAVQRLLLDVLAGDDPAARARIHFSTHGAGFACRVGGARVFCTHGNEVDAWNYNRYEDLATLARRLNSGLSMRQDEWRPNAGTRLVKEVMNGIKRSFAWIDLLKPETSAALGTLLVLDPARATQLVRIAGLVEQQRRAEGEARGRLSAGPAPRRVPEHRAGRIETETLLGANLRQAMSQVGAFDSGDDMLAIAEQHLAEHHLAEQHLAEHHPARHGPPAMADPGRPLGVAQLVWDRLLGLPRADSLRHALLDWLEGDKSFDFAELDEANRRICATTGPAVDFIVSGHTHLERAIALADGRFYFNSGTWMRLLRLTPAMLASRESFEPVWRVLADGSLRAIDDARFDGEPFVLNRSSAVAIRRAAEGAGTGGPVIAELLHVEGDGCGEPRVVQRFVKR